MQTATNADATGPLTAACQTLTQVARAWQQLTVGRNFQALGFQAAADGAPHTGVITSEASQAVAS